MIEAVRTSSARFVLLSLLAVFTPAAGAAESFLQPATRSTEPQAQRDATVLDRFVVEATRVDERPWRYVALPGYEVLTRCDNAQNAYYLSALLREIRVERAMLPEGGLTPLSATNAVILYDSRGAADSSSVPEPAAAVADDAAIWGAYAGVHLTGSGVAEDEDTRIDCLNLSGRDVAGTLYTTRSLSTRLRHHTPEYPRWLVEGLIGFAGVYKQGYRFITPDGRTDPEERSIYFPPALWISAAATQQTRARHLSPAAFLPVAQLFVRAPKDPDSALWSSEAALFVRWALFARGRGPSHQAAFWKLVERAQREEVTDAVFTECFGFGFDQMDSLLPGYLPTAVTDGVRIRVPPQDPPVPPPTRTATPDEIARIIGDWERISGNEYASFDPNLARHYYESAESTLLTRYREGGRDPALLGVLGLYRYDRHEPAAAAPLLERAARGPGGRPKILLTLAMIELEKALANPGSPNGQLSGEQTVRIADLLALARTRPPELPETYSVLARAWLASSAKPSARDLATLETGTRLFWTDGDLARLVTRLTARWAASAQ